MAQPRTLCLEFLHGSHLCGAGRHRRCDRGDCIRPQNRDARGFSNRLRILVWNPCTVIPSSPVGMGSSNTWKTPRRRNLARTDESSSVGSKHALSKPIKLANLKPDLVHFFRLHISSIRPNLNCRGSHRAAIIDILAEIEDRNARVSSPVRLFRMSASGLALVQPMEERPKCGFVVGSSFRFWLSPFLPQARLHKTLRISTQSSRRRNAHTTWWAA